MIPGAAAFWKRSEDENADSGAETAESEGGRTSWSGSELLTGRRRQPPRRMDLHLLADPGDSPRLQLALDRLLRWLYPSLRIFHVSERASPLGAPAAGYPSLAVTFFLHEAYGEERILKALEYLQRPPWQFHHTESDPAGPSAGLLRPYLLPSRDFYGLGAGMPVWGVRPVHCGGEILRLTLYSAHRRYQDAVHFYQTVLQRRAQEQKAGFCWFTLHCEPGRRLQLALKRLSPGVRARRCSSAVLQFRVEEMGQLVPLLPGPCSPISSTRWQTEDPDGNKVLFHVKAPAPPERPLTCAFPPACPGLSCAGTQRGSRGQGRVPSPGGLPTGVHLPPAEPVLDEFHGGAASLDSGSCSSVPSGSSCRSSPDSSPAPSAAPGGSNSLLRPSFSRSLSHLLPEEAEEETNVDTGVPAFLGTAAALAPVRTEGRSPPRTCAGGARVGAGRPTEAPGPGAEGRAVAQLRYGYQPADEFFI